MANATLIVVKIMFDHVWTAPARARRAHVRVPTASSLGSTSTAML